ncbi:uncharacterized protein BDCG_16499 [Blastomyces dermatitidis ER-3]|uniref:Uncharacterized protein n=1 Tax=Ajellomyces dermatitidis (strain ER-3 / ATCC MYA-2586) TaxID=559297 RepID=A0ABX2VSH6_AJEDR|nr:uncharacterized protein BDCG_16499 [Blastomyces dermatitidis ER-3]OAT00163.1 hypothetical protein BDCG_16499 [Blastomyces dermatitidis ER-3]
MCVISKAHDVDAHPSHPLIRCFLQFKAPTLSRSSWVAFLVKQSVSELLQYGQTYIATSQVCVLA